MKTSKIYRNAVIFIITVSTALILLAAQINYKAAINAASKTDCSDMQIEESMKNYGFNVDANEIIAPSMVTKIKALFN